MEDLAAKVLQNLSSNLTISTRKKPMCSVESIFRYAVVGKTFSPTGRDVEGLISAIVYCWKTYIPPPNVYPITDEIFVVRFHSPEQLKRALEQGPWNVYGQIFLIKPHSMTTAPQHFVFDKFKIWFFFDNLPYRYRDENQICELLEPVAPVSGIFPELSFPKNIKGFKVQICVSCDDPLPLGVEADDEMGGKRFVTFNYQNLPAFFCVRCRRIGHKSFSCQTRSLGFGDDGISDGVDVAGFGRILGANGENDINLLGKCNLQTGADEGGSSNAHTVGSAAAIEGGADVGNPNTVVQAVYSPTTGLLPKGDVMVAADSSVEEIVMAGSATVGRNRVSGKSIPLRPNPFGVIGRPVFDNPQAPLSEPQQFPLQSDTAMPNDSVLFGSRDLLVLDDKQKGKRTSLDASSAGPSLIISKRSRLDSIVESVEKNLNHLSEDRNVMGYDALNSVTAAHQSDFLGLQLGNLPAGVFPLNQENAYQNPLISSLFTAVNRDDAFNPHRVEITRIAELMPTGTAGLSSITRFHPYPNFLGGRSGVRRRSISENEDRHEGLDFSSLDIIAGARQEEQPQTEEGMLSVESVSESDTPPCGHTA